jgi:predicted RNA-binding protein
MNGMKEWHVGNHVFRREEADLLWCTYKGPTRASDIERFVTVAREMAANDRVFVVSDIRQSTIEKDARELLSQSLRPEWLQGLVYVGADALQKAIVKAMMIALYFTGKCKVDIEFAQSEQEARDIIARTRQGQRGSLGGAAGASVGPSKHV